MKSEIIENRINCGKLLTLLSISSLGFSFPMAHAADIHEARQTQEWMLKNTPPHF